MVSSRTFQSLSNIPSTPGRAVKHLKSELEKKETENEELKNNIADLTKALEGIQIVQDKTTSLDNPFMKSGANNNGVNNDEKKKKKQKDEDAPVPAKTAYRYYCEDINNNGTDDKQQQPKSGETLRQLWKECQGDARKKYVDMAAEDKKRFEKENEVYQTLVKEREVEEKALATLYQKQKQELAMEFYEAHLQAQSTMNETTTTGTKKKKEKKDPDAPKGAMSSYLYFCQEKREELTKLHTDKAPTEITKLLGEEWKKLSSSSNKRATKKYDDMAAKDKSRYEKRKEGIWYY